MPESLQVDFYRQWWLFNGLFTTGEVSLTAGSRVNSRYSCNVYLPQTARVLNCTLAVSSTGPDGSQHYST